VIRWIRFQYWIHRYWNAKTRQQEARAHAKLTELGINGY
jgi:hypothetical protein